MSLFPILPAAPEVRETVRVAAKARRIALRLTQADLAARSGVPIATLKRFEQRGEASFATLLALAEALDALDGFAQLFPMPETRSLDELDRQAKPRQRVRRTKDMP